MIELNGIANAIALLETEGADSIHKVLAHLRTFCEYARACDHTPMAWHEFLRKREAAENVKVFTETFASMPAAKHYAALIAQEPGWISTALESYNTKTGETTLEVRVDLNMNFSALRAAPQLDPLPDFEEPEADPLL